MTARAAVMAQIITEQWDGEEPVEDFALRHFANDKMTDFNIAVDIFLELNAVDAEEEDARFAEAVAQPVVVERHPTDPDRVSVVLPVDIARHLKGFVK